MMASKFEYYDEVRNVSTGEEGIVCEMCDGVMTVEYTNGDREEFSEMTDEIELLGGVCSPDL